MNDLLILVITLHAYTIDWGLMIWLVELRLSNRVKTNRMRAQIELFAEFGRYPPSQVDDITLDDQLTKCSG